PSCFAGGEGMVGWSPWLWCVGEGGRGVFSGTVVGHGGFTMAADFLSVEDRFGTVHDPTSIEPFTSCTVCMRHQHSSPLCAFCLGSTRLAQLPITAREGQEGHCCHRRRGEPEPPPTHPPLLLDRVRRFHP